MTYTDDEAKLTDALEDKNEPLTYSEAKATLGGGMKAEVVLDNCATVEERGGDELVVGTGGDVMFSDASADDAQAAAQGADADAGDDEGDDAPDADIPADAVETSADEEPDGDWYELAGLRVTVDPDRMAVGDRTGDDYYGVPILTDGREDTPTPDSDYYPTKLGGGRDSEEVIGRMIGEKNYPVLLEGEAGTGKNTAFANFGKHTNRPVPRMDFGDDTTVFDLIGEKDIVDGTTVYLLGELSKAAMFGHIFDADEISMAEGDVTSHLHAITESVGKRRLNLRGTGRTLRDLPVSDEEVAEADGDRLEAIRQKWDDDKHLGEYIHPEFRFVATTNPLGYAGTSDMNGAFRSRFAVLELDYLEPKYEAKLLAEKTGIDEDTAKSLTHFADGLREAHRNDELMCPITFRELEKTVELAGPDEEFMDLKDAAKIILKGHASQKLDKQTITDTIADEL